jgi:hypothetical protein
VVAVQPDSPGRVRTDPAAPLGVPPLGWWLQSHNGLQSCYLYLSLLNLLLYLDNVLQQRQPLYLFGVYVLLEGSVLHLQVEDPLQVVSSLQLQLEPPGAEPVVLLLNLGERETLLLVRCRKTVPGQPSRLQTLAVHRRGVVAQPLECEQDVEATCQRTRDVQWLR